MFCEQCGNNISGSSKFCDKCGAAAKGHHPLVHFLKSLDVKKPLDWLAQKKHWGAVFIFILVIVCLGYFGYQSYAKKQQQLFSEIQQQQNALDQVKQQDQQATQTLTSQLATQETATEKAEQQSTLDEQALALLKQQTAKAATSVNNLPNINTRAIVLIVCDDGSGNDQSGSGTIISSSGYVLTNKHVVTDDNGNALTCAAVMNDGSSSPQLQSDVFYTLSLTAPNAGYFGSYDAALLKISGAVSAQTGDTVALPSSFPFIKPAGGNLKPGDVIYIFGYPGASDLVFNVTKGIVSSFSSDGDFINTDAVIDHGNSGGAAITSDGRFVGIPTQKYVQDSDYLGQIFDVSKLNLSFLY